MRSKTAVDGNLSTALRERLKVMERFVAENQSAFVQCTAMMAAWSMFLKGVRDATDRENGDGLCSEVFSACDVLRSALRDCGLEVVD